MKQSEIKAGRAYSGKPGSAQRNVLNVYGNKRHRKVDFIRISDDDPIGTQTMPLRIFASWAKSEVKGEGV